MRQQKVLISWHDTAYGLGFLKNIVSAFHLGYCSTRKGGRIHKQNLPQEELEAGLLQTEREFPFDKLYILHVSDEIYHRFSTPKDRRKLNQENSELIMGHTTKKLNAQWDQVYQQKLSLEEELAYLQETFPEDAASMQAQLWRRIHAYPFADQVYWLTEVSNFAQWKDRCSVETVDISFGTNIKDLRALKKIAQATATWMSRMKQSHPKTRYFINLSMGGKETQVAWYLLNERNYLPEDTTFFRAIVIKSKPPRERFTPMSLEKADKDIFQTLKPPQFYVGSYSPKRTRVNLLLKQYFPMGFSILLLGPRGVGKTRLITQYGQEILRQRGNLISLSSELLNQERYFSQQFLGDPHTKGLLYQANQGILFLDDVHTLSRERQLSLLPYFATNAENKLANYASGNISTTFLIASNLSIEALREVLHPDFYDRMVQLTIDIPSLAEASEDREKDWQAIWQQLRFPSPTPTSPELLRWLKSLPLPGNYRDLQRIAIAYKAWSDFPPELRKQFPRINSPLAYARHLYETQQKRPEASSGLTFSHTRSLRQHLTAYKQALAAWAHATFGSDQKAAKHFQGIDPAETITRETLNKWRNG